MCGCMHCNLKRAEQHACIACCRRVRSDLGLKVALSLVPADMEAAIAAKYNLTAQPLLSHRRRSLLQSANATSNTTSSTALLPPDWVYLADYASEAPEPYSTLEPAPLPPSYLLNTAALAPDAGNAIQDRLSAEAGVASFAGVRVQLNALLLLAHLDDSTCMHCRQCAHRPCLPACLHP